MFDAFYIGKKPGVLPHERPADSLAHARVLCRTRYFWIVTYLVDYTGWDWFWEPVPWEAHYQHAWPSQHQPDSGTYLCPKQGWQQIKYHISPKVRRHVCSDHWYIPDTVDFDSVDQSWHPNPLDPPCVYHFPSQWQKASGVVYSVPGAIDIKLVNDFTVNMRPDKRYWNIPSHIDPSTVDMSWHPDVLDQPYIYHFPSQWQTCSGVVYSVPGANTVKLTDAFRVQALPNKDNWWTPSWIDIDSIDFSWHPDVLEPKMIYHFATTRQWDRIGGPEYRVPGATDIKYVDDIVARTKGDQVLWHVPDWIDPASIDPTWCPDPSDPAYIYEFPVEWGWDHVGGPEYRVPGATERKYVTDFVARTRPDSANFEVLDELDPQDDVFRWRPNPCDSAYIYVFGNQWWPAEKRASAVYRVPGAVEVKYMSEPRAQRQPNQDQYRILVDAVDFDWSWEPDPGDPPYIYVFGNQWHSAEIMPTVEYTVPGAQERKFMDHPRARLTDTHDDLWHELAPCSWDRTWVPDPGDPPYIYVFGNQWHPGEIMPTIEYHVPGATERKFAADMRGTLPQCREPWYVPDDVDADAIDYSWRPDPGSPPYIYHFGTEHQASVGVTYTVLGAQEIKFAGDIPLRDCQQKAMIESAVFFVDFSNALSSSRFQALQSRLPNLERVRYVNSMLDTLRRCAKRSMTPRFWVISSHNDYTGFDFSWHPETWQRGMIHVFGTQWSKWSDTFLVNRWEFERQSHWQSKLEDFYNLNFVTNQTVIAATDAADIIVIDHGNLERERVLQDLSHRPGRVVRTARYFDNYLDTLRRVIDDSVQSQHVWVCSTLCDYTKFDFSWQPEAWQRDMIHVFASGNNKFGDTFLVPVAAWRQQQTQLELLDWFDTVHYVPGMSVPRWSMPVIRHSEDTHVEQIQATEFSAPFMLFTVSDQARSDIPTVSIWRDRTTTIVPLDIGAESVIVPQRAVPHIRTQFYDYPHIDRSYQQLNQCASLDVVFICNGEPNAEDNWNRLIESVPKNMSVHRIDGVNRRVDSQHAAARISNTSWYFVVPAKLEISLDFDWSWQPDRMQQPKHYIFHAHNPVNNLIYGHQAMVAYNKKLVLANNGLGLDFTLDNAHEVVPRLSGVARYNVTPLMAWRTAFREVLKLRASLPDIENEYRISRWCRHGSGDNAQWSVVGAQDALEYYDQVQGDFVELRKSYEWQWLANFALLKRNLLPNQ